MFNPMTLHSTPKLGCAKGIFQNTSLHNSQEHIVPTIEITVCLAVGSTQLEWLEWQSSIQDTTLIYLREGEREKKWSTGMLRFNIILLQDNSFDKAALKHDLQNAA